MGGYDNKKITTLLICILLLTGCSVDELGVKTENQEVSISKEESSDDLSYLEETEKSYLKEILVEYEVDLVLKQAIVSISNNSPMVFAGNIHANFKNTSDKLIGKDVIFVDKLEIGQFTVARIDISGTANVIFEYSVQDVQFSESENVTDGEINAEKTKSLNENFSFNFDVAKWYPDIVEIIVMDTSESAYVKFTVKNTTSSSNINSIGNCLFANYLVSDKEQVYKLNSIVGYTGDGEEVFRRES